MRYPSLAGRPVVGIHHYIFLYLYNVWVYIYIIAIKPIIMWICLHICFSTAREEDEDGASHTGHLQGASGVPAPLYSPPPGAKTPLLGCRSGLKVP